MNLLYSYISSRILIGLLYIYLIEAKENSANIRRIGHPHQDPLREELISRSPFDLLPYESDVNPFLSHISQAWRVQFSSSESASKEEEPFREGDVRFRSLMQKLFGDKPQEKIT